MNLDKYFRCYAKIDLDNIRKNAENLKAKLKADTGYYISMETGNQ